MKNLREIDSSKVVALDIETCRIYEKLKDAPEDMQTAWSYKNKDKGRILEFKELELLWDEQSALFPEFAKIISVSMVFKSDDGRLLCQNFTSTDEKFILEGLSNMFTRMQAKDRNYRLIGHSSLYFDFPWIAKRCIINGLPVLDMIDNYGVKPWLATNLDTNQIWKGGYTGPGSSLVALCSALGLEISKDDMVGSDVADHYFAGNLAGIGKYCDKDTIATFNVFLRFKGEEPFLFADVVHLGEQTVEEVKEEAANQPVIPVLTRIFRSKGFTEEDKQELEAIFLDPKKTFRKKEWAQLDYLLTTLYQNNKIMQSDKPDVLKEKAAEVKDFIEVMKYSKINEPGDAKKLGEAPKDGPVLGTQVKEVTTPVPAAKPESAVPKMSAAFVEALPFVPPTPASIVAGPSSEALPPAPVPAVEKAETKEETK